MFGNTPAYNKIDDYLCSGHNSVWWPNQATRLPCRIFRSGGFYSALLIYDRLRGHWSIGTNLRVAIATCLRSGGLADWTVLPKRVRWKRVPCLKNRHIGVSFVE